MKKSINWFASLTTCREPQGRAIGIMERWNYGIKVLGKYAQWAVGKTRLDRRVNELCF